MSVAKSVDNWLLDTGYIYISVCVRVCVRVYVHVYVCMDIYIPVCFCMYMHIYICMPETEICMYVCMYDLMCLGMNI